MVTRTNASRWLGSGGIILVLAFALAAPVRAEPEPSNALYVMRSDGSQVRRVLVVEALPHLRSPRWSHDGLRIALEGRSSRMSRALVVDVTGKNLFDLGAGRCPDWSPDDKQIVCEITGAGPSAVWVQNADGKGSSWLCSGSLPRWSADGSQLAVLAPLRLLDLVSGEFRAVFSADDNVEQALAYGWSPEGLRLAVVVQRKGVMQRELLIVDLVEPAAKKSVRLAGQLVGAPAWSPDGKQLAINLEQSGQGQLHLLEVEGQGPPQLKLIPGQEGDNRDPAWSPDGQWLSFVSTRATP